MNNNHGRRRARRASKKAQISRILLTICMMALVAMVSVGATLAWLTDETEQITNTFTATDIEITLTETPNQTDGTWEAQMIPGKEYSKNPVVTVTERTNVDVYLFVEFTDPQNVYLDYEYAWEADTAWKKLTTAENVYYREVGADDEVKSWHLLVEDKVTVSNALTKDNMITSDITMTFQAYAIQQEGFTDAAAAWAELNPTPGT